MAADTLARISFASGSTPESCFSTIHSGVVAQLLHRNPQAFGGFRVEVQVIPTRRKEAMDKVVHVRLPQNNSAVPSACRR